MAMHVDTLYNITSNICVNFPSLLDLTVLTNILVLVIYTLAVDGQ